MHDGPIKGTISPIMRTQLDKLSYGLFGKVRSAVLALLFSNSEQSFYFRQIARSIGSGRGAVQRELVNLLELGLIISYRQGNQVYYQANPRCPIFSEIKSLMIKTCGVAGVLQEALTPIEAQVRSAFIYGSLAKGLEKPDSDVDVLVIGNVNFSEIADLFWSVQKVTGREINPSVYPENEFITKVLDGHHFVTSLIHEPKIFLIGDEDGFTKLVEKRLAS